MFNSDNCFPHNLSETTLKKSRKKGSSNGNSPGYFKNNQEWNLETPKQDQNTDFQNLYREVEPEKQKRCNKKKTNEKARFSQMHRTLKVVKKYTREMTEENLRLHISRRFGALQKLSIKRKVNLKNDKMIS